MLSNPYPHPRAPRIPLLGFFLCLLAAAFLLGAGLAPQAPAARPAKAKHKPKKRCPRRTDRVVEEVFFRPAGHHRSCRARRTAAANPAPATAPRGEADESKAVPPGQEAEHATVKPVAPHPAPEEQPASETTSEPELEPTREPEPIPTPTEETAPRLFSATSIWNAALSPSATLDPESSRIVGAFNTAIEAEAEAGHGPTINTSNWSIPLYVVPSSQPTVRVIHGREYQASAIQAAWERVPLPEDAHPASGTDAHLVVWQPSTDRLWEFWHLVKEPDGWHAGWGGAMEHVSTNPGVYGPEAWPGATNHWGASASSLSIAGGLMTLSDFSSGRIEHALAMAIPNVRQSVFSLPAQRTDGTSSNLLSLPEGAHLRLDPSLNLATLNLPPLTREIAEAAQKYGIVIRSKAAHVVLYGQDPTGLTTNPYGGAAGYFEGLQPGAILAAFPWNHLELLKMELRSQ